MAEDLDIRQQSPGIIRHATDLRIGQDDIAVAELLNSRIESGIVTDSGESDSESSEEYDSEYTNDYERQLSDAQREWERSLEQLWQALTWIVLPLAGKLIGRRTAGYIWRRVMSHLYS